MKNKKELTFKIEILAIILLIILLICNIISLNNKNNKLKNQNNDESTQIEKLPDYIKIPKRSYAFLADYSGNISMIDAYKAFYELSYNNIPTYYSELKNKSANQIEQYYEQNKTEIYTKLGINNSNDFANLIKYISNLKGEKIEVESFEFDKESIIINKDETSANLNIVYKDNDNITLNITLLEKISDGAIIKVKSIK